MPTQEYLKRKSEYVKKYQKENYTHISFKLRTKEDKDIIDFLNSLPNKSEFLKNLIKNCL